MSFYLIEDLEQGSSEWHAWRRRVIGASDANNIMGDNRLASRARLMKEKLGLVSEFGGNATTIEGRNLEGPARALLSTKYNLSLIPTIVQDAEEPYLAASLDAICSSYKEIFEIKAGVKTYEYTRATKSVPRNYVAQLQHILMVTQLESITFAVYRPHEPLITLEVCRDDKYIEQLRMRENEFIDELVDCGHLVQSQFVGRLVD